MVSLRQARISERTDAAFTRSREVAAAGAPRVVRACDAYCHRSHSLSILCSFFKYLDNSLRGINE